MNVGTSRRGSFLIFTTNEKLRMQLLVFSPVFKCFAIWNSPIWRETKDETEGEWFYSVL